MKRTATTKEQLTLTKKRRAAHIAKFTKMKCNVKGCDNLRHAVDCVGYLDVTKCKMHVRWDLSGALALLSANRLVSKKQHARISDAITARFG